MSQRPHSQHFPHDANRLAAGDGHLARFSRLFVFPAVSDVRPFLGSPRATASPQTCEDCITDLSPAGHIRCGD